MFENDYYLYNNVLDEGWDRFGKFAIKLKTIINRNNTFDKNNFELQFKSLNDNESRVKYCFENDIVMNAIKQLYEDIIDSSDNQNKDLLEANLLKQKGNTYFKDGYYRKALELYSEAVCLSPFSSDKSSCDENIELSKAFANRSAALFRVEDFDSCLLDIEDSISLGYPKELMPKILIRKAQCLAAIGKRQIAEEVLNGLVDSIKQSDGSNFDKINAEVKQIRESFNDKEMYDENSDDIDFNDDNNDSDINDKIEVCNPLVPNASRSLKLTFELQKGRHMTAVKDITFGDTLMVEYPFATYLHSDKFDSYCQNCLIALENRSIPCFECKQIRFCSETCRQKAWDDFHQFECKTLLKLFKEIGISYISFRILFKAKISNSIKIYKDLERNRDYRSESFNSDDYQSVLSLLDHQNDHSFESQLSYTLSACFLLFSLQKNSLIDTNDENYLSLGALLLKHIQQLSTNLISILEQSIDNEFNKFGLNANEDIIGSAIYPTVSLLNHSCDPNVLTFFKGSLLSVKASKSIKIGQEISYCYGPNFQGMSRNDRRLKLKNQYYFDCECYVCFNKKENLTRALLCHHCNGPVIHNEDFSSECLNCKNSDLDVSKTLDIVEEALKLSSVGTDCLDREKFSEALIKFHKSDELLTLNLYIQNRQLIKSKDDMCRCYAMMGHFDRAVKYCQQSIKMTALVFGEESAEVLTELMKQISLKWEVVDETTDSNDKKVVANELMDVIKRADNIISKFLNANGFEKAFQSELQYLNEKKLAVLQIV